MAPFLEETLKDCSKTYVKVFFIVRQWKSQTILRCSETPENSTLFSIRMATFWCVSHRVPRASTSLQGCRATRRSTSSLSTLREWSVKQLEEENRQIRSTNVYGIVILSPFSPKRAGPH